MVEMNKKLTMLMILDGFGNNQNKNGNAIEMAEIPNINKLKKTCPVTEIYTSGLDVGLPEGQMGNSEVGHTNIGAGRIVYQELTRITKTIEDGDFFSIPEFTEAIENCKKNNSKLHIMGLLSDGGVHSHIRHLYALLELAKRKDFENVYIHCFLDGRDTPPASGETYIMKLNEKLQEKGIGKIASISGRFYSMDRDKRWERVKKSYDMLVNGIGNKATSAISAIESSYQKEIFDEYCEWLFGVLAKLEKRMDLTQYDNYNQRMYGFVSERLINVWIHNKALRVKECPIYFDDGKSIFTKIKEKIAH